MQSIQKSNDIKEKNPEFCATIVNKYKTEFIENKALGSGAFSTVFEAKSLKDGQLYAIKKIPFKEIDIKKTTREIKILESLKHDYTVKYIDSWIESNYYIPYNDLYKMNRKSLLFDPENTHLLHIQMELCSITLSDFIKQLNHLKKNSISLINYEKCCDIFVQLLECVQYLHELNPPVIHRDLKPENIVLVAKDEKIYCKLTDFGLSTYHKYVDQSHSKYMGTRGYRAPEVDSKYYDTKADVFSLGIIMQELFNFNINSELIETEDKLKIQYSNAIEVCSSCVSSLTKNRPNCNQILSNKNLWILNKNDNSSKTLKLNIKNNELNNKQSNTKSIQSDSVKITSLTSQLYLQVPTREISKGMDNSIVANRSISCDIESKYGSITSISALIIQRAWRSFCLRNRFKLLAIQALNTNRDQRNKELKQVSSITTSNSSTINRTQQTLTTLGLSKNSLTQTTITDTFKINRKRRYRVGLNLFNKSPIEQGIPFLIKNSFIDNSDDNNRKSSDQLASNIANFLLKRKGVSKTIIGDYISTNDSFNELVLKYFSREIDLTSLEVDAAFRHFQTYFRLPGKAQKIERLVNSFADRYIECNPEKSSNQPLTRDQVFILSFAIIMLNTGLHVPALKYSKRITCTEWKSNLRGVLGPTNDIHILSDEHLTEIYERIKLNELRTGNDHVSQVIKVRNAVIGKDIPLLALPHRRLVCYCRFYEIFAISKKARVGQHQREVFLFNDLLLITKLTARAKSSNVAEYYYRQSITLDGLSVSCFTSDNHKFGVRISRIFDDRVVILMKARNDLDRSRFIDDISESIAELKETLWNH